MGKPRRTKKNAGVGVDFKKVKRKVGKKLPRAQNQTDTTIKSRSISLAEQSLAADKAGQAVTARNLTLKEVLGQCGHYSERVRKDALQGLAELLQAHPEELRRHTTLVMETAAERIADGDRAVRAALRDLLAGTLLPALGGAALAPFVPLLMAHVCAAMTHLAEPIRADALGFLELLTAARADLVAASYLAPVLRHFSDQLSRGSRGRSIGAGSLASLHSALSALERFLARSMAALAAGGSPAGSGATAQQQQLQRDEAAAAGEQVLMWRRCQWPPADSSATGRGRLAAPAAEGGGGRPAAAVAAPAAAAAAASGAEGEDPGAAAASELLGHLLDCWSEAGPSQLAESPELVSAQCLTAILRCCDLLLGRWGPAALAGAPASRSSLAASLLRKVAPHFPVQRPAVKAAPAVAEQLVQLNVAAAQLLARFLPGSGASSQQQQQQGAAALAAAAAGAAGAASSGCGSSGTAWEEPWVERLLAWFAGVMAEGAALPASDDALFDEAPVAAAAGAGGGEPSGKRRKGIGSPAWGSSGGRGGASLPGDVYQSALDGTLQVLPLLPPPRRQQLLAAVWRLWQRSPARGSGGRVRVLAFWQALLRDPAAAFYAPAPGGGPLLTHAEVAAWLAALPRFLFELGSSTPTASRDALRLLLGAARTAPPGSQLAAALQELQPQLAPLFAVLLPPGKQQQAAGGAAAPRVHLGPLGALPPETQELAVDLLYHFPAASEQLLRTAAVVCLGDAYPAATAVRLLEVLGTKAAGGAAEPAAFCGLLVNVLTGSSRAGLQQRSWRRHEELVAAACHAVLAFGDPAGAGAALLPPMLEAATGGEAGSASAWASYGLLQLCVALAQAAAAAQQLWQPPEVAALPLLMLQLQVSCQPQAAAGAEPSAALAAPVPPGSGGSTAELSSQDAAALSLRLLALSPRPLLPALLAAVASELQAQGSQAQQEGSSLLAAAMQLLQTVLHAQALRDALLDERPAVQAVLAACQAACATADGGVSQRGREAQEQLQQLEALCTAVLGS